MISNLNLYCDNCGHDNVVESTVVDGIVYHFCMNCYTELKKLFSEGRSEASKKVAARMLKESDG